MPHRLSEEHFRKAREHHGRARPRRRALLDRILNRAAHPCSRAVIAQADFEQTRQAEQNRLGEALVASEITANDMRGLTGAAFLERRNLAALQQLAQALARDLGRLEAQRRL